MDYGWQVLHVVLLLLSTSSAANASASPGNSTCRTRSCLALTAEMTSMMNFTASPCNDFYNFACGNFPTVTRYKPSNVKFDGNIDKQLFEDSFSVLRDKVERNLFDILITDDSTVSSNDPDVKQLYNFTKSFFRGCEALMRKKQMGNDSNDEALSVKFLKDAYNHLMFSIGSSDSTVESVMAALTKSDGRSLFTITATSGADKVDTDQSRSTADAPLKIGFKISSKYRASMPQFEQPLNFFEKHKIGKSLLMEGQSELFSRIINRIEGSERDSEHSMRRCDSLLSAKLTIANLDKMSRCHQPENPFSWSLFFYKYFNRTISDETIVETYPVEKLIKTTNYFKELPLYRNNQTKFNERVSLVIFDWLLGFAEFLPRQLEAWTRNEIFGSLIMLETTRQDITGSCIRLTEYYLQPIVHQMYLDTYHPDGLDEINSFWQLLKNASIQSVNRQLWISESAKADLIAIIHSVQPIVGFRKATMREMVMFYKSTLLDSARNNLTTDLVDNFGNLFVIAQSADSDKNLNLILERTSSVQFLLNGLRQVSVLKYAYTIKNRIIFPMGLMSSRLYDSSYPDYIKLGSLGYIIGHEIANGFGASVTIFNGSVFQHIFLDNLTESVLVRKISCFVESYGKCSLYPGGPMHLHSEYSVGSDISDIIGLRAAYEATRTLKSSLNSSWTKLPGDLGNYSPEQLFFIQAAQNWCLKAEPSAILERFGRPQSYSPHSVRVNGMAQHTQEFADAFKCSVDAMNPAEKCSFW